MSEPSASGGEALRDGAVWALGLAGVASLWGGLQLIMTLRPLAVTGGVLLLVAALGLVATAVGQGPYGPEVEGRLDLSTRIATGLLGGALGGAAHLLGAWILGVARLPELMGVDLLVRLTPGALAGHVAAGAGWGLLFGLVYRWIPGRGAVTRGLAFSAVPALWVLLRVYPGMKYGLFGLELGYLTFVVVGVHHLVWGAVVGGVTGWAERADVGPLSRPLGA